jgi:hypothetical protein
LAEISKEVATGAHAILTLDGAGYRAAADLKTPDNITLLPLPSHLPKLNPMENVWGYLRKNKLAITMYNDYEHIVDKSCETWNFSAADKAAIASITSPRLGTGQVLGPSVPSLADQNPCAQITQTN